MRALRRSVAAFLLVWFLPACSTYQTTALAPQEAVAGEQAVKVTLADADSTEVTVAQPWVRADSIGGLVGSQLWSVPLSSVSEIKTRQFSGGLTAAAVFIPILVLGSVVAIALSSYDWS